MIVYILSTFYSSYEITLYHALYPACRELLAPGHSVVWLGLRVVLVWGYGDIGDFNPVLRLRDRD